MKLTALRVQNYRSLVDIDLPLRDLAVVIGPNGSGKTALLEVFQLLQHGSRQRLSAFLSSHGGFQAVLSYSGAAGEPPVLQVGLGLDTLSSVMEPSLGYRFGLIGERVGYVVSDEVLESQERPGHGAPIRYVWRHGDLATYDEPGFASPFQVECDEAELALAHAPAGYHSSRALRDLLANCQHYSFLDVGPRAPVRLPQSLTPASRPGPNGESLYSALHNLRASHHDIYDRILALVDQGFPGFARLEFPVVGAGQVTMTWYERDGQAPFYPNQLSEGTLRFLWLITTLLAPPPPAVLLLDEPEVSLHPELLKLLAAVLQDASARSQIVVATHSPDLIRWLRPDEVLIADKEEGRTRFTWADALDLKAWLAEYTLRDLWLMGTLGGRP